MTSSPQFLLSILCALSYHVNDVFGEVYRTCICAEFTPDQCDEHMLCKWNANTAHTGDDFGLCRSLRWYTCHVTAGCTTKGYLDPNEISKEDAAAGDELMHDWPWNCHTLQYESSPVDIQQYHLAVSHTQIQSKQSFVFQSFGNMVQYGNALGLVVLITLVCSVIYYVKRGRDSDDKPIDLNETNTYGTLP